MKTTARFNNRKSLPVLQRPVSQKIEFEKAPDNLEYFADVLDKTLKQLNSDYEAKRYNDYVLKFPLVKNVEKGTFYKWFSNKNRLGGQSKVPRLSNERKFIEEILEIK